MEEGKKKKKKSMKQISLKRFCSMNKIYVREKNIRRYYSKLS